LTRGAGDAQNLASGAGVATPSRSSSCKKGRILMPSALGLDFGTTNTVLAAARGGVVAPIPFSFGQEQLEGVRTALSFWRDDLAWARPHAEAGPWAIERFVEQPGDTRFMQSFKTFAASANFLGAYVHAARFTFEDLLETFVRLLRGHAGESAQRDSRIVVGRPVHFAGAAPDPDLAQRRYREAFRRLGFSDILFVYEPLAASFYFARTLQRDAVVLVADFGGGTTDFSLMRFQVGRDGLRATPVAHGGVGVAGDTFDYRIVDHVILPLIGKGSKFRSMDKILELPRSTFASFARWSSLSLLKTSDEFREIKRMLRHCLEPAKVQTFIDLVEDDLGWPLYRAVAAAKAELSQAEATTFAFAPMKVEAQIARADFEGWIADDLARIETALDDTLTRSGLREADVDRVFLTGGSSFVPAVRAIFSRRFGAGKIETGDELLSIANGLALIGARDDAAKWTCDG
jgi:hypothetical chaperone protein